MKAKDFIKKGSLVTLSTVILFSPTSHIFAENGEFKLNNSVQIYDSEENALKRENGYTTLHKGKYYIYDKKGDLLNISKKKGESGKWINVKDNLEVESQEDKIQETISSDNYTVDDRFEVLITLDGYMDANSAKNNSNSVTKVKAGKYYVYYEYDGMINITKIKGVPGAWINPNKNIVPNNIEKKENEYKEPKEFILIENTKGYYNSGDAVNGTNGVTEVKKGEYFIYAKANGMVNITKDKDSAGVWINPNSIKKEVEKEEKNSTHKNKKESLIEKTFFIQNPNSNITVLDIKDEENSKEVKIVEETYTETMENKEDMVISKTFVKVPEINEETVKETVRETTEEIETKTETQKEDFPKVETILEETNSEEIVDTQAETQKESKEETIQENLEIDSKLKISETTKGYNRFTDAVEENSSFVEVQSGEYYIHKKENKFMNISSVKGKAGLWIKLNR